MSAAVTPNAINYTIKIPYFSVINFFPSSIPTNKNQGGESLDREKVEARLSAPPHTQSNCLESHSEAEYALNVQNWEGHRHVFFSLFIDNQITQSIS
jgi:hypothetical protein